MRTDFFVRRPYEVGEVIKRRLWPKFWVIERWVVIGVADIHDYKIGGAPGTMATGDKLIRCIKEGTGEEGYARFMSIIKK